MRLILEKAELVRIIGKHFDSELDPTNVIIRTDPFEVEVSGIPLSEDPPSTTAAPSQGRNTRQADEPVTDDDQALFSERSYGDNASLEPPESGTDGFDANDSGNSNPLAILARSRELEEQLKRENPNLGKPVANNGSHREPGNYQDEI